MEKKKLLVSELRVERFELVDRGAGITVLEVTAAGECGDTEDMWVCQSFESCPPSHPFQKECM
jgi:hypothetical protein